MMGLNISSSAITNSTKGKDELLRMQMAAATRSTKCQGPHPFAGAKISLSRRQHVREEHGQDRVPSLRIRSFDGIQVAFIGLTLKVHRASSSPVGVPASNSATKPRRSMR